MNTITLRLQGLPNQTITAGLIRVEDKCAIVRGYTGGEERYSLPTGTD